MAAGGKKVRCVLVAVPAAALGGWGWESEEKCNTSFNKENSHKHALRVRFLMRKGRTLLSFHDKGHGPVNVFS